MAPVVASCPTLEARPPASRLAENEEQGRAQHQPGQHPHEGVGWGPEQQECADDSADEAGRKQRQQNPAGYVEPVAIRASAGGHSRPKGECVGGVGGNWRHADEQQSRKGDKAAAAGDCVQSSAHHASGEKKDNLAEV